MTVSAGVEPEGTLDLLAPPGAFPHDLLERFTRTNGCLVSVHELTDPNRLSGLLGPKGRPVDVVAVRSDQARELIDDGLVAALDRRRLSMLNQLARPFRRPDATTVDGTVYGVPYLWTAQALLTARGAFPEGAPASWRVLYDATLRGQLAIPDSTLQVAAAARFLGYASPFSLNQTQLAAVGRLLRVQRPLVRLYGNVPTLLALLRSGAVVAAAGPPSVARGVASQIEATVPQEGTIGWTDTLLLGVRAKHPHCAYRFLQFVLLPRSQARLAAESGAGPTNPLGCRVAVKQVCQALYRGADAAMLQRVSFAGPPGTAATGRGDWADVWSASRATTTGSG
jgi:putative spermidine/putrescine transport system substrate-binding protein